MAYDSTQDTIKHIRSVQQSLLGFARRLLDRGIHHDESSLEEPEKQFYDQWRPVLSSMPFGSPEYEAARAELMPALQHHYQRNRHHPEHHANGVNDMTLLDLLEMLADWKAAIERKGGTESVLESIQRTKDRFGFSDQLVRILENTAREVGWP
jgi:hypothetical protein